MIRKNFCTIFMLIVLTALVVSSCEKENAPAVDPNTLPSANFSYQVQYKTLDDYDANTYAYVTATNNSAYSNRWKWHRPGSIEILDSKLDTLIRPVTFETKNGDSVITQVYLATNAEQIFKITLTAYSDVIVNKDSTITFVSRPFTQEVKVKKP